jgi:hypothetical protein
MWIPDGAHTHGSGGGGFGTALLVLAGAALAVKLAAPVAEAVGELVHVLLVLVAVVAGTAGACLLGFCAWRLYRWRQPGAARVTALSPGVARAAQPLSAPQRSAAALPPADGPQEIHLHLHGVSAEDVAAILARQNGEDRG